MDPYLALYAEDGNKNASKSLIAAEYCRVEIDHVKRYLQAVSSKRHVFLKNSVFTIKNPIGKVPVLITEDGPIVENNAMVKYVAQVNHDSTLLGYSAYERSGVDQWMRYITKHIDEILVRWVYMRTGVYPYTHQAEKRLIEYLHECLHFLNFSLRDESEFLVCDYITLADIVVTCDLYPAFANGMPKVFTSRFPEVERYFWKTVSLPIFKKFLGEIKEPRMLPKVQPEIKPDLCVSRGVCDALCGKRIYLVADLEKEKEVVKAKGVNNMVIDLEKEEGANNKVIDLEKEEGANDQLFEPRKKELDEMTEKQRERVNKMVLNDDVNPKMVEAEENGVRSHN